MIRRVTTRDFEKLFNWVNDEAVRKNARYTEEKSLTEYKEWFSNALKDERLFMFIYIVNYEEIGQAKLQIEKEEIIINYSIDKEHRGKGFGTVLIKEIEKFIDENKSYFNGANKLTAYVRTSNIASCKVFEKFQYVKVFECEDYIKFQKICKFC